MVDGEPVRKIVLRVPTTVGKACALLAFGLEKCCGIFSSIVFWERWRVVWLSSFAEHDICEEGGRSAVKEKYCRRFLLPREHYAFIVRLYTY